MALMRDSLYKSADDPMISSRIDIAILHRDSTSRHNHHRLFILPRLASSWSQLVCSSERAFFDPWSADPRPL